MPQQLNVIALISGGKDSIYSVLHCLKHGHKVVALANLHPPVRPRADNLEEKDLDSFMYQTIGHEIIPLYQEALEIPLYRAEIKGTAVDTAREYSAPPSSASSGEQDETESLFHLLRDIKAAHPEANAVSAGAILSTYQRTRIENVAGRLGLVPLAWLWMYPYLPPPVERGMVARGSVTDVTGLLEDMAACGCEARIVKVASGGLDEGLLWEDVCAKEERVRRELVKRMGMLIDDGVEGAVLGEGGEYESLALNGPRALWKRKIEVEKVERETGEGGVAFTRLNGAKCVEKADQDTSGGLDMLRVPQLLDDQFRSVLSEMAEKADTHALSKEHEDKPDHGNLPWSIERAELTTENTWTISNLSAPEAGHGAALQMEAIKQQLLDLLDQHSQNQHSNIICPDDIVFTTILLRSMGDFNEVNSAYGSLFKRPCPPARVTVACGDSLPSEVQVLVSFVFHIGPQNHRKGLHVQSRSYWAPANIGPYSQAIGVPLGKDSKFEQDGGVVYIAGQIPLDPQSMELAQTGATENSFSVFLHHTVLALQHLWTIGRAMNVKWWLGAVAFIASGDDVPLKVAAASSIWEKMNTQKNISDEEKSSEDSDLDAWDIKYGRKQDPNRTKVNVQPLPDYGIVQSAVKRAPFLAVEVDQLPRGSQIEWQGFGLQSSEVEIAQDGRNGVFTTLSQGLFGAYIVLEIENQQSTDMQRSIRTAVTSARVILGDEMECHLTIYTPFPKACMGLQAQIVPCRHVWGEQGRPLAAGIVIHSRR